VELASSAAAQLEAAKAAEKDALAQLAAARESLAQATLEASGAAKRADAAEAALAAAQAALASAKQQQQQQQSPAPPFADKDTAAALQEALAESNLARSELARIAATAEETERARDAAISAAAAVRGALEHQTQRAAELETALQQRTAELAAMTQERDELTASLAATKASADSNASTAMETANAQVARLKTILNKQNAIIKTFKAKEAAAAAVPHRYTLLLRVLMPATTADAALAAVRADGDVPAASPEGNDHTDWSLVCRWDVEPTSASAPATTTEGEPSQSAEASVSASAKLRFEWHPTRKVLEEWGQGSFIGSVTSTDAAAEGAGAGSEAYTKQILLSNAAPIVPPTLWLPAPAQAFVRQALQRQAEKARARLAEAQAALEASRGETATVREEYGRYKSRAAAALKKQLAIASSASNANPAVGSSPSVVESNSHRRVATATAASVGSPALSEPDADQEQLQASLEAAEAARAAAEARSAQLAERARVLQVGMMTLHSFMQP
jgi:hypothetical protein